MISACYQGSKPGKKATALTTPAWVAFAYFYFYPPLTVGGTTTALYYGRLPAERYLQAVDEFKVNSLFAPPTAPVSLTALSPCSTLLASLRKA